MELLIPSFIAGVLTVIAPCALSLLPVIIGGSATNPQNNKFRPLIISLSLAVSVIIFTLLLRGTTEFIGVPEQVLRTISTALIFIFGLTLIFPQTWTKIAVKLKLYKSDDLLHKTSNKQGTTGAILLGASLGPVFTTCSPTYAFIIGTVLLQDFGIGALNIVVYALGLFIPMLIIGYGGRKAASKFRWAANPNGWFKKILGIILVLTSISLYTGFDKQIETYLIDKGYFGPINIENQLLEDVRASE